MPKIFTVKCPKCGHEMKYFPRNLEMGKKSKQCVYCGKSFKVHFHNANTRITKVEQTK